MALASQSIRSTDRRRITFSQRRLLTPRSIALASVAISGVVLVWWTGSWLFGGSNDEPEGTTADETLGALVESARGAHAGDQPAPLPPPAPRQTQPSSALNGEANSIRSLVADDRRSGEATSAAPAIEMGGRNARPQSSTQAPPSDPPTKPTAPPTATPPAGGGSGNGAGSPSTPPSGSPPAAPTGTPTEHPTGSPAGTPPTAPPVDRPVAPPSVPTGAGVGDAELARAFQLRATDPVAARVAVTRALAGGRLSPSDRERAYELVNDIWKSLFLNANINPNDPMMAVHTIKPGESLAKVVRNDALACETLLLKRINGIKDERRIQIGQRLRVPKGAFHAEVLKGEFRINLFLDAGPGSTERVMIASFRCGLGESNGTPTGMFKVRPKSKLIDPEWTHPKTGQHFASNDPMNPIGEHWIGIMGVEAQNQDSLGYGIHGTIDPSSIGQEKSLGCVRLAADDIAFVYECLVDPQSTILIK